MQRSELLWSLSGPHTFFFILPCHRPVQQSFNPVNVLISKFFTGQTGRQMDKTDCLTPLHMRVRGNNLAKLNMHNMVHTINGEIFMCDAACERFS